MIRTDISFRVIVKLHKTYYLPMKNSKVQTSKILWQLKHNNNRLKQYHFKQSHSYCISQCMVPQVDCLTGCLPATEAGRYRDTDIPGPCCTQTTVGIYTTTCITIILGNILARVKEYWLDITNEFYQQYCESNW